MDPIREQFLRIIEARPDIDGRFVDIRRIGPDGGGGFTSLVLLARDVVTGRQVALKVLHPGADQYRRLSFDREVQMLGELAGHDGIVKLVAPRSEFTETLRTATGLPLDYQFAYFGLELARTNAEEAILSSRWQPSQTLAAFRAMCRSVQRVHAQGKAHRDLKPANFLVFRRGVIKLSDFGTARSIEPGAASIVPAYMAPPGDLRYAPPEMLALLHERDPRIAIGGDLYALGAILFELATGSPLAMHLFGQPYARDLMKVMAQIDSTKRKVIFDQMISSIRDSHPLPSLRDVGCGLPLCILGPTDDLYQALADLDYRKRIVDFNRVFRQLDICTLVLRNDMKARARLAEKRKRRRIARSLRGVASTC